MKIERFMEHIRKCNIQTFTGVPDSTLQVFCNYLYSETMKCMDHVVAANEGAAVGIAIGEYLATGRPTCVYMQNSGLGNIVNPYTSLTHKEVYGIPMLFVIGWRGEPGESDEPQHKFMGKVTLPILKALEIDYDIVEKDTSEQQLSDIFNRAYDEMNKGNSYALVVKKGTFDTDVKKKYANEHKLCREIAIQRIVEWLDKTDIVVSTTGKISRELYEQCDKIIGNHEQVFLTVGGMGHADMIAYQIAKKKPEQQIICLDGDGALLMHMGSLGVIGQHPISNFLHICINNEVHESVGGMPTGVCGMSFSNVAESVGYKNVYKVFTTEELRDTLKIARECKELTLIEIFVSTESRADLGRPKETAEQNKQQFMRYHGGDK